METSHINVADRLLPPVDDSFKHDVFITLMKWSIVLSLLTVPVVFGIAITTNLVPSIFIAIGLLLTSAISWWCLRKMRQGKIRLATRLYLIQEMLIVSVGIILATSPEILNAGMAFASFVFLTSFIDTSLRAKVVWAIISCTIYAIAVALRGVFPEVTFDHFLLTIIVRYISPSFLLIMFIALGSVSNIVVNKALAQSRRDRVALIQTNSSLEETVAVRTAELRQALETAEDARHQAERMRYFMQGLGHDLKTPAATIEMCLDELMHVLPADEADAWREVHRIDEIREVLSRRIWTMLDIATGMENGLTVTPTSFQELEEEATHNMISIRRAYNAEHVLVRFDYQPGTILVDGAALGRAIENLVVNSIKAQREQAQGWVRVQIVQSPNAVTITVEDDGAGFPQMRLQSVETVTTLQKRPKGSHGLGLVGVRTIVEMLGGTLRLANRVEGGAQVTITLPQPDTQPILEGQTHATDTGH